MTRERVVIAPVAPTAEERRAVLERARRRGFSRFALDLTDREFALDTEEIVLREGESLRPRSSDFAPIPVRRIGTPAELDAVVQHAIAGSTVAIEWTGDRLIPLENAIAAAGHRFHLWVIARDLREVPGALGALEHGAERVIVAVDSPARVDALESILETSQTVALDWVAVEVSDVSPAGVGDRVIVDTTSLLSPVEGLLVGSAAAFLFHVASEAVGSRFSRARPFRVNAGAAHSYTLLADGSTRYLSELEPGDAVLACVPDGRSRSVRVGRVKIERRPLVVVRARVDDTDRTVFLQEAETVRLSSESGRVATTELTSGTRVRGVRAAAARHLGRAIQETIIER